jgi:hypothetical protein
MQPIHVALVAARDTAADKESASSNAKAPKIGISLQDDSDKVMKDVLETLTEL